MKRILFFGFSILPIILFIGCGGSNPNIATIGDENITLRNFEDSFVKSNNGWDSSATSSLEDKQKFLDLVIKYKLKVKEARSLGLETDSAIVNEMNTYNVSVSQSYMIEKEVVEPGIRQMYDRKKEETRASHIMFRLTPNAKPEDTLKAYEKAMNVLAQMPKVPFDTLASKFSEDPLVKQNNGDLGFFTGGRMVPEFEDACYLLKTGDYSKLPVRSKYGYHILKVTARQPYSGSVRVSHIFLKFNKELTDTAAVRDSAWMVYKKIKGGESFTEMVKKYSQDMQSIPNNGDIGLYERERLPQKIADIFYSLKVDSISEPMFFNYGYQIFKITEKKLLPSFEETKNELKAQYQQVRYQYELKKYTTMLKTKYRVVIDSLTVQKLISSVDTTKMAGQEGWKDALSVEMLKMPVIRSTGQPFTVKDFAEKVSTTDELKNNVLSPVNIWGFVNKMLDDAALKEHASLATERYPLLGELLKEYEEGILLYRIEQDEVWNKVVVNDSLLQIYYNEHKDKYRWPERVNFAEIFTTSDSIAKVVYRQIQRGKDFADLVEKYTTRPGYKEKKGVWGMQTYSFNELSKKASAMSVDSISAPFKFQTGWSIIKVLGKDSLQIKSFEEASPEVVGGYQEIASKEREQKWLESLKKKYPVTINKEELVKAFQRKRVESK